ncbi:3-chlorobenzoate-3,4-dioxygenase reductase subunit [Alternaria sp. MG1]|nr:3-chlorobenzoate-3,4-dioxygenase reductase subunit [Alternaria sp. MG1]
MFGHVVSHFSESSIGRFRSCTEILEMPTRKRCTSYKSNTILPTPRLTQLSILPAFSSSSNPVPWCSTLPPQTSTLHVPQLPTSHELSISIPTALSASSSDSVAPTSTVFPLCLSSAVNGSPDVATVKASTCTDDSGIP